MANALIGIQHDDNTVTAIECYEGGELSGAGSTLYSCYAVRDKVEALVRFGSVRQLAASLASTGFISGALASRKHKPQRFGNRNEYARAGALRTQNVYLMPKSGGGWNMLEGVGTKGNPRWPGLKRVIGENGLRAPITTKHDDHNDPDVIAGIEALVGASSAAPAVAPQPNPASAAAPASAPSGASGSDGVVLEPIVIEVI